MGCLEALGIDMTEHKIKEIHAQKENINTLIDVEGDCQPSNAVRLQMAKQDSFTMQESGHERGHSLLIRPSQPRPATANYSNAHPISKS